MLPLSLAQFSAAIADLQALPMPPNLLDPGWQGVQVYRDLIDAGRGSPEVAPFLERVPLPDLRMGLYPETVRKSLKGLEIGLGRRTESMPPWKDVDRCLRRDGITRTFLGDGSTLTSVDPAALEALYAPPVDVSGPASSRDDVIRRASQSHFIERWIPFADYHNAVSVSQGAQEQIPEEADLDLYARLCAGAGHFLSHEMKEDPLSLFMELGTVLSLCQFLQDRWLEFVLSYCRWKNVELPSSTAQNLYDNWSDGALADGDFGAFVDASHVRDLKDLSAISSRITLALRRETDSNPGLIKTLASHLHGMRCVIPDRLVNGLFTLSLPGFHHYLETALDWNAIRSWRGPCEQYEYSPVEYGWLDSLLHYLELGPKDVVYDLGSGYGHMVFYMAAVTSAQVRGIEIVPDRYYASLETLKRLRFDNVRFYSGNVAETHLGDGNIFIIFNSFSPDTLVQVAEKLRDEARRRPIRVVSIGNSNYVLPVLQDWLPLKTVLYHSPAAINPDRTIMIFGPYDGD